MSKQFLLFLSSAYPKCQKHLLNRISFSQNLELLLRAIFYENFLFIESCEGEKLSRQKQYRPSF